MYSTIDECMSLTCSGNLVLSHRRSSLKSVASCSLPMTRKSAKTSASSPPIRTAEGETESQSGQASWPLPRFLTTALWDEERGALEKKLDLPRGKMTRKRGEKGGVG